MKSLFLPLVFARGSTTSDLNAQINNKQMWDWDITPKIIELFWTEIKSWPWKKSQYNQDIYTKKIICKTDTVTINAIIDAYSKRPGVEIKGTPDALENFDRIDRKTGWNPDVEKILWELLELEEEEEDKKEETKIYHYCPQAA